MKSLVGIAILLLSSVPLFGQFVSAVRWDLGGPIAGVTTAVNQPSVNGQNADYLIILGNVSLNWCSYPANSVQGSPCTNYAPTYTDLTLSTPCSSTQPIVLQNTNICISFSDSLGNLGVNVVSGTYTYTLTSGSVTYGPYTVSVGGTGGGGSGGVGIVLGTANQIDVANGSTAPIVSLDANPIITGTTTTAGLRISGLSFSFPGYACFDGSGNLTTSGCPTLTATASGTAAEVQFRNASTGNLNSDGQFFYNPTTHTITFQNGVVNGQLSYANAFGLSTSIPLTSACTVVAGMSSFGINTDGQFAVSVNGGACNDLNTTGLPTGVAKGSNVVSAGIGVNAVFQTKPTYDVRDAAGASVGAQIDAACATLGSNPGVVIIPAIVASGQSIIGITDTCHVVDYRGISAPNLLGQESTGEAGGTVTRTRFTTDHADGSGNVPAYTDYLEAFSGGQNGGTKTNWEGRQEVGVFRTPGQHNGFVNSSGCWSEGDCVGFNSSLFYLSRNNAGGDEGIEGVDISLQQYNAVATGTVTSVVGTTVTMGSQSNQGTLGELRPLIITTSAKVFSTGTIVSISGSPPVVTGSGTSWSSLCSVPCSPTNLFFALTADITSGLKLVVPIRTVTDATHITLNFQQEGADAAYPTANSGAYKIYKGGIVQTLNNDATLASVTVSPATDFVAGDTVEEPSDYWHQAVGLHIALDPILPGVDSGLQLANISTTQPASLAVNFSGNFTNYFSTGGVSVRPLNLFTLNGSNPGTIFNLADTVDNNLITLFNVERNASPGGFAKLQYDKSIDQWGFNVNGGTGQPGVNMYGHLGIGTNAQTGVPLYINSATSADTLIEAIFNVASPSGNLLDTSVQGVPRFRVTNTQAMFNNGLLLKGFSDNQSTEKWRIDGSTGISKLIAYGSQTANQAASGLFRAADADQFCWRNHVNGADVCFSKNSSDIVVMPNMQIPTGQAYQISTDTGLSRDSAGVVDIGNGTPGDVTGTLKASTIAVSSQVRVPNLYADFNPGLISCGTTGTCSNTPQATGYDAYGKATLSGGTLAYAGLPFATTTWLCNTWDITTPGTTSSMVQVTDATHATITGTGTDVIGFSCRGK